MLGRLYENGWDVEEVVLRLMREKGLTAEFVRRWGRWLELAVEDPDALWTGDVPEELVKELEARNLIVYNMYDRRPSFWIDQPPPREGSRAGHRQKRHLADPHTQRSGEKGVVEGLVLLWLELLIGEARSRR